MQTQSLIALLGICSDENSSFRRGAAQAPPLIREALLTDASNMWAETGVNLGELQEKNLFIDVGDIAPTPGDDFFDQIQTTIHQLLAKESSPISLGGDHAITFPILQGFARHFPELTILHIDAHPDLYDELGGNRLSHACPFARIMEAGLAKRLIQVGIRTLNQHQREQAARFGVEIHEMKDWHPGLKLHFDTPVYVSIDLDGLDPAFAPGVSHREPGGLSTREVIHLIHSIPTRIIGADVVEYNPRCDFQGMTATVAAKLVKELAGKIFLERSSKVAK